MRLNSSPLSGLFFCAVLAAPLCHAIAPEHSAPPLFPANNTTSTIAAHSITAGDTVFLKLDNPETGVRLHVIRDGQAIPIKDIDPNKGSSLGSFARLGNKLFFYVDDGLHGAEPWVTDGSGVGTYLLKDIVPGQDSSNYYFSGYNGVYRSDERSSIEYAGYVFFLARNRDGSVALWRTDGTENGTQAVEGAEALPGAQGLAVFDGTLFIALNNGIAYLDSPAAALAYLPLPSVTTPAGDSFTVSSLEPRYGFGSSAEKLYFLAYDNYGRALWSISKDAPAIQYEASLPGSGVIVSPPVATSASAYFQLRSSNQNMLWFFSAATGTIRKVADIYDGAPVDLELPVAGNTEALSHSPNTGMIWALGDDQTIEAADSTGSFISRGVVGRAGNKLLASGRYNGTYALLAIDLETLSITSVTTGSNEYSQMVPGESNSYAFSNPFQTDKVYLVESATLLKQAIGIPERKSAKVYLDHCRAHQGVTFWTRQNDSSANFTAEAIAHEGHPIIAMNHSSEAGEYPDYRKAQSGAGRIFFTTRNDNHTLISYLDTSALAISQLTFAHTPDGYGEVHELHGVTADGAAIYSYRTADNTFTVIRAEPDKAEVSLGSFDYIPESTRLLDNNLYMSGSSLLRLDIDNLSVAEIKDEQGSPLSPLTAVFGESPSGAYVVAQGNTPSVDAVWWIAHDSDVAHPLVTTDGPLTQYGMKPLYAASDSTEILGLENFDTGDSIWTIDADQSPALLNDLSVTGDLPRLVRIIASKGVLFVFLSANNSPTVQLWKMSVADAVLERVTDADGGPLLLPYLQAHALENGIVVVGQDVEHGAEPWFVPADASPARLIADINPGGAHSKATFCGDALENLLIYAYDSVNGLTLRALAEPEPELEPAPEPGSSTAEKESAGALAILIALIIASGIVRRKHFARSRPAHPGI